MPDVEEVIEEIAEEAAEEATEAADEAASVAETEAVITETTAEAAVALAQTTAAAAELQAAETIEVHDERMELWRTAVEQQVTASLETLATSQVQITDQLRAEIAELRELLVSVAEKVEQILTPPNLNETIQAENPSSVSTRTEPLESVVVEKPRPRRRLL